MQQEEFSVRRPCLWKLASAKQWEFTSASFKLYTSCYYLLLFCVFLVVGVDGAVGILVHIYIAYNSHYALLVDGAMHTACCNRYLSFSFGVVRARLASFFLFVCFGWFQQATGRNGVSTR